MKTYYENKTGNRKPVNWYGILDELEHTDSQFKRESAATLAESWVTCACGNQCAVIPRDDSGCPLDPDLRDLGLMLPYAILNNRYDYAKNILNRIEIRSLELIKENE